MPILVTQSVTDEFVDTAGTLLQNHNAWIPAGPLVGWRKLESAAAPDLAMLASGHIQTSVPTQQLIKYRVRFNTELDMSDTEGTLPRFKLAMRARPSNIPSDDILLIGLAIRDTAQAVYGGFVTESVTTDKGGAGMTRAYLALFTAPGRFPETQGRPYGGLELLAGGQAGAPYIHLAENETFTVSLYVDEYQVIIHCDMVTASGDGYFLIAHPPLCSRELLQRYIPVVAMSCSGAASTTAAAQILTYEQERFDLTPRERRLTWTPYGAGFIAEQLLSFYTVNPGLPDQDGREFGPLQLIPATHYGDTKAIATHVLIDNTHNPSFLAVVSSGLRVKVPPHSEKMVRLASGALPIIIEGGGRGARALVMTDPELL